MRRAGRVAAVQILYQLDTGERWEHAGELVPLFFAYLGAEVAGEARSFAEALVSGTVARLEELDRLIELASQHWRVARMSRVDRSILRLATHELTSDEGTPPRVVLNEAVELAKELGAEESSSFVNGVLSRVASNLGLAI
jgi:N utilization substance protein B